MLYTYEIELCEFVVSAEHAYFSRQVSEGPAEAETILPPSIELVADRGIIGDRFFDTAPRYRQDESFDGQVTFVSAEVLALAQQQYPSATASLLRRNIVIRGVNLQRLIGEQFSIVCEDTNIEFFGTRTCSPCRWVEHAGAKGLRAFLRGRGGLRTRVVSSGTLALGPALLLCHVDGLDEDVERASPRPNLP